MPNPPVPLLDVAAENAPLLDELLRAADRVLRSGRYILGPEVETFEAQIAARVQVKHAIGVSSGTDALLLAFMALGIGPGDEVICPSFTFFATAGCVARVGATPVFADSCPVCFNLDVADAERRITARTKAIVPVHLFGQAAAMPPIMALAEAHHLWVIEDAAQALGAEAHGKPAGSWATFGAYSFYPSKNLGGFGDAGMLVTHDDALAARARQLRTHGAEEKYFHERVGGNFRIDPLQAALLSVKLPHLDRYAEQRRRHAAYYLDQLGQHAGVRRVDPGCSVCLPATQPNRPAPKSGPARIVLPAAYAHNVHIWNQFTIRVGGGQRDGLKEHLAEAAIGSEIYYPLPLHRQKCFHPHDHRLPDLPVADQLAAECLSLPVFPQLTREQQDRVIGAIRSFSEGAGSAI